METKDILTIGIALLGWSWAIIQFFLNRRNQRIDRAIEKRFEVYAEFMSKMDEINQNMRTDPNMFYGINSNFFEKLIDGNEEDINVALSTYNNHLIDYTRKSLQPIMIMNQELNKLKMVCSEKLLPKIEQYKKIANDFSDEFQIVLNELSSSNDLAITSKKMQNLGHSERSKQLGILWPEIENMMREEIGYFKK
jgi:uncharacterized membrane protein YgaE (UPF0421/DUF939 family)